MVISGGIQNWTVSATGTYRITAVGAQGESAQVPFAGGLGASLRADLFLEVGAVLQIAVGQAGLAFNSSGGGGGGSFVVSPTDEPLLVAGGGGGTRLSAEQDGCDASLTTFGIAGVSISPTSDCPVKDVDEGQGGIVTDDSWGSGGAGFFGDGELDVNGGTTAALSWANGVLGGGIGGAQGGFGGGGGGNGSFGGGGGGGYSGGDGGWIAGSGPGSVTIETLEIVPPQPEPEPEPEPEAAPPVPVPAVPLFGVALLAGLLLLIGTRRRAWQVS